MYYVPLMNIIKAAKFTNTIAAVALSIDSLMSRHIGIREMYYLFGPAERFIESRYMYSYIHTYICRRFAKQ